jgi:hypothetical protein
MEQRKKALELLSRQIADLSAAQDRLREERLGPPSLIASGDDWKFVRMAVKNAQHNTSGADKAHFALLAVVTEHAPALFRLAELDLQAQERALRMKQRLLQQQLDSALAAVGEALGETPTTGEPA